MKDPELEILEQGHGLLLCAPVASGKTSKLLTMISHSKHQQWVFLSPLKALALEFEKRAKSLVPTQRPESRSELRDFEWKETKLLIGTYELFSWEWVKSSKAIFILDEFHLIYLWGKDFREKMGEVFMAIITHRKTFYGLTATLSEEIKEELSQDMAVNGYPLYLLDKGNFLIQRPNFVYILFSSVGPETFLRSYFLVKHLGVSLIFCRYRQEVERVGSVLKEKGFDTLTCVGGQTLEFQRQLENNPTPEVIVTTQALGHGVNLPLIGAIYFFYDEPRRDMQLQMVGRGARAGQKTWVFAKKLTLTHRKTLWGRFLGLLLSPLIVLKGLYEY